MRGVDRRLFPWVFSGLFAVGLIITAGPAAARQGKLLEVQAAYPSPNVQYLPAFVAKDKGIYREEGLDVTLISMRGAKEAVQALVGGQIQFIMTIGPEMPAIWKGIDIKLLAQQVGEPTFSLIVRPDIKSVQDLKGKKLGVSFGGSTYSGLQVVLEHFKVNPDKEQYINIPGSGPKVAAMEKGLIAGALLAPPSDLKAIKAGFKRLVYLGDVSKDTAFTGLATTEKLIRNNPNMVKRMVLATVKSVYYTHDHPQEAITVMTKELRMNRKAAEQSYDLVRNAFNPVLTVNGVNEMAHWQSIALGTKPGKKASEYMDLSFLHEALRELGHK